MRLALLSDIHANVLAFEAALEHARARGAERIVVAGDLVGDGPDPSGVVRRARTERLDVVRGNVDRIVASLRSDPQRLAAAAEGTGNGPNRAWTARALAVGEARWLADLSPDLELSVDGLRALVVHGGPLSDTDRIYPSITARALAAKLGRRQIPDLLVCGHTHVPFVHRVGDTLVANAGSAGRPVDGDPDPSYVLVEAKDGRFDGRVVRFPYPVDELVEACHAAKVPGIDCHAYATGDDPKRGLVRPSG